MKRMTGLGALVLILSACGGGAGNNVAAQNEANEAAPAGNAANMAAEEAVIPINEQQLLSTCVPANERELTIQQLPPARRAALNRCYNEETVRQLTPRVPIRIDSQTVIDQVRAEGQNLIYRYRIARRLATLPAGLAERLEADTRRHACAGEDVRNIVALGGAQIYRWIDGEGALIREVRIDSCPEEGTAAQ